MANLPTPATETFELVHSLYEARKDRSRLQHRVGLIHQIAERNETAILPYLLSSLFDEAVVARAAIQATHRLIRGIPANQLPSLSETMRRPWWDWCEYADWDTLEPAHLLRFKEIGEPSVPFWGLLSFHSNGYVREAALGWLEEFKTGEEIPFLLIRANDWVPQVRCRAADILESRLTPPFIREFAEHLELVVRLESSSRADTSDLVQNIHELLRSEQGCDALLEQLESDSRVIGRAALQTAIGSENAATIPAIRYALDQSDVVLRTRAVEAAGRYLDGGGLARLLAEHRHDPHRMVRKRILETFVQQFPGRAKTPLSEAIFDSSRSIRQYARFYLDRMGEDHFLEAYRKAARSDDTCRLRAGLRGLGDIGKPEDAQLVAPHLSSRSSKTRRIAIRALGEIDPSERLDLFVAALRDDIGSNSRAAADVLAENIHRIPPERLLDIYTRDGRPHVRDNILRLFDELGYWSRVEYLLRIAAVTDKPEHIERLGLYLDGWIRNANRVFTSPSASRYMDIEKALHSVTDRLPTNYVGEIREILRLRS